MGAEVCRKMNDKDAKVRIAAISALPQMGERGNAFAEEVVASLEDEDQEVRLAAVKAIELFGPSVVGQYNYFIEALAYTDPSEAVRDTARQMIMKSVQE